MRPMSVWNPKMASKSLVRTQMLDKIEVGTEDHWLWPLSYHYSSYWALDLVLGSG